ncbi:hypothetical protein ACQPYH_36840 [Kribbella sp. CA-245084]|uniref:hypothetical protein n=1 Tax=Kribbella sp. CA-245084 TaxID=3239940 RepID=UPI003D8E1BB9
MLLADLGLPSPLPQAEIRDSGGSLVARVDFLFAQYGVIARSQSGSIAGCFTAGAE